MGKGKKRAPVWQHYELSIDGQGKRIAHCKRCRSQLVAEDTDGTTHVKRHLKICTGRQDSAPPDVPAAPPRGASPESSNFSQAANWEEATAVLAPPPIASPPPIPAAPPLGAPPESSNCSKAVNWEEAATADLARMIALHGYDPSFVEDSYFRSFVRQLNPDFQVPSRADVEDICDVVYDEANGDLRSELERTSGKVSISIDTAETALGKVLYAACHFIDEDWNRRMVILDVNVVIPKGMEPIPNIGPLYHVYEDGVDSYDVVESTDALRNLLISQRVFSVAVGNILNEGYKGAWYETAYNHNHDDALQMIGRCFDSNIDDEFLHEVRTGYHMPSDFIETRQERGEFYSQFALDHLLPYEEKWISSYFWLEIVHKTEKREAISSTLRKSQELVRNVFAAIYRASKTISDPNRPTSNIVLRELFKVRETLQSSLADADANGDEADLYEETIFGNDIVDVLQKAEEILDKSIKKEYLRCSIPLVLDPRYKLEYIEFLFNRAFSSEKEEYIAEITAEIKALFTSFSIDGGDADPIHGTEITTVHQLEQAWGEHRRRSEVTKTELDWYLEAPLREDTDDFDILNWWKDNSSNYPTLARMARAALAMPTSSKLSSEQMSQITSIIRGYSKRNLA